LIISDSRLQAFRAATQGAASATARHLLRSGPFPWDLRVPRAALCRLSEFPEQAVFCDEEMMASVLVSHHGWLLGTSVISLEPRHALELIRSVEVEGDPLDVFRMTGAKLLQGILGRLGAGGAPTLEFGDPTLEEDSLVATVLGTHAPRDTMVVSLEIGFVSARQAFPAYLYLLLDAKVLESTLGCLEGAPPQ
jgi:hypothetical protein